jgi:hypothetical protein
MDATTFTPTPEERTLLTLVFKEIREGLADFMNERDFKMSNPQIFTFLTYAPVCLAIASDREVDEAEIRILSKITENIDVNKAVSIELMELMAIAPEPGEVMLNEEFNMRVDAELLYLSRNIDKYEEGIISALKSLLKIDKDPKSPASLHSTFAKWFDYVVERNAGRNKEEELAKVKAYKEKIGLI